MGRIRTLPPHVVNQIAAGEVVERPASVVKELVENAVDAGATRVDVRLSDGGKARIEVADDGVGMDADDVAAAFLPHATSKIASVDDLEHVGSLGFRGEALASIGSVARCAIVSRPHGASTAHAVDDREGRVGEVRPAAGAHGTVVTVEGLFASVPARRKFLRATATEAGHAVEALERIALAHPEVGFRLEHDGRVLLDAPRGEDRRARLARFHGEEVAAALLRAEAESGSLRVEAYASPPGVTRADARLQQTWLNGRAIRDRTVQHALREAYRDLVPPGGRHPIGFVFLSCDPARVDVNVHPTKAEVRWRDSSLVHEAVRRAVRGALEAARPGVEIAVGGRAVPASTVEAARFAFEHGVGRTAFPGTSSAVAERTSSVARAGTSPPLGKPFGATALRGHGHAHGVAHAGGGERSEATESLRPLGQALGTYLVFEAEDGIVLVDQHALHERVLFDEISARLERDGSLEVQHLLVPTVVHVGAADAARLDEERDLLARLGWVVEPFGPGAVAVRGLPAVLRRPDPEAALREALALLDAGRRDGLGRAELLSSVVDRMACRSAVMAGDVLQPDEVRALLDRAERLDHAHSCPHGRPTRLVLTRAQLERHFHRTV